MSKKYFAMVADSWDSLREGYYSEALRDEAIGLAAPEVGKIAADIGAGTGFMTQGLAAAGLRVIAVDESEEMLNVAREKEYVGGSVSFRVGSAVGIPLGTDSVDYVFANMLLHHVEDPAETIREMQRVLKPGGRLVVTDLDAHEFEFLRTEQHDRWMGFERRQMVEWMVAAGLVDAKVQSLSENCCSKSEEGTEATIGVFAAVALKPAQKTIK